MRFTVGDLKKLLETASDDTDISSLLPKEKEVKLVVPEMATEVPIQQACVNIKHSINPGDVIASLAAAKTYYEITKRKVNYLQRIGHPASYYHGATHETTDDKGGLITMNKKMFEMLKPLMESQEYINKFEEYDGQRVDVDFDVIRGKTFVNMPHGSIQAWLFYAFPDLARDISKAWVTLPSEKHLIEEVTKGKVLINFTARYRNSKIMLDYFFLREYAPDLMFTGTPKEHFEFCNKWNLNIPLLEVKDFLELAYALRGCRFLLSNQSFCWNLLTSIGGRRLLEVCDFAHNCMPFYGENNYGYFHQISLGHYFRKLYNETMYNK